MAEKKVKVENSIDKKIKVEYVDPRTLTQAPWNPKDHTERGLNALDESLNQYGWMEAVVTWKGIVINGNARLKVALERKEELIPVIKRDSLTEEEARAYSLISTRIPQFMVDNEEKLFELAKAMPREKLAAFFTADEMEEKRNYLQELLRARAANARDDVEEEVQKRKRPEVMLFQLSVPMDVYDLVGDVFEDWFTERTR